MPPSRCMLMTDAILDHDGASGVNTAHRITRRSVFHLPQPDESDGWMDGCFPVQVDPAQNPIFPKQALM